METVIRRKLVVTKLEATALHAIEVVLSEPVGFTRMGYTRGDTRVTFIAETEDDYRMGEDVTVQLERSPAR